MPVDLEARILHEPQAVPGQIKTGRLDHFFTPHDEAPLGYWRKPDGWVILAQYGENGTERKLDRGFERLGNKYGSYASAGSRGWDPSKDPLYPLVAKGGIVELPAEQIKQLGWHRAPDRNARRSHLAVEALVEQAMTSRGVTRDEAVLLVMPQLRDIDMTDYTCALCKGRHFVSPEAKANHDLVMHREMLQSESIGKSVAAANAAAAAAPADSGALLTLIAQQGDLIAEMKQQLADLTAAKAKPAGKAKPTAPEEPAAE